MSELETRKKLLIAESEVYRETLKLEMQSFRIYGMRAQRKMKSIRTYASMLMMAFPVLTGIGRKKRPISRLRRFASLAFLGWQALSRLGGFTMPRRRNSQRRSAAHEAMEIAEAERRF